MILIFALSAIFHLITLDQYEEVARKIWKNECGMMVEGLTTWNQGEAFASMGIGHFIWYPEGYEGLYEEQFPAFLSYAKLSGATLPEWLREAKSCPWKNRDEFIMNFHGEQMVALRDFLNETLSLQARYIASRFEQVLDKMTLFIPTEEKDHVTKMFLLVMNHPGGVYPLADYLNFKGDGTSAKERYQGKGWGLLQVLQAMSPEYVGTPVEEFVKAAKGVLQTRVNNAESVQNESKWLNGWFSRLNTYLQS
jgi:hypothetical protein